MSHPKQEALPFSGESLLFRELCYSRLSVPWHFHQECELTLLLKGKGLRYVGDSIEQCEDGDLVFLGRNLPHYWWQQKSNPSPLHSISIQFDEKFTCGLFELEEARAIRALLVRARRGLLVEGHLKAQLAENLFRMKSACGWRRICLLLESLGHLADEPSRLLASDSYARDFETHNGKRLRAVCQYINESFSGVISQRHAASLAGFSPAAFSRFFHKRMGKTFEAYVTEVRIGHACRGLAHSDNPITTVAFEVGFNNLSNFNRHFRHLKGLSPREYRHSLVK